MKVIERINGYDVVSIEKDENISIVGVAGSRFIENTIELDKNNFKAKDKLLLLIDYSNNIIKNIIDCIPYIEDYSFYNRMWNRIRRACINSNRNYITTVKGIVPFTGPSEMAINKCKNEWYIVNRSEVPSLLEKAPAKNIEYKVFYIIKEGIGHYYIEPDYIPLEIAYKMMDNKDVFYVTDDEALATSKLIEMNKEMVK